MMQRCDPGERDEIKKDHDVKLTINSIETRNSATKGDYAYGKGTINKKDGSTRDMTIMSFGAQFASAATQAADAQAA
jgi:hypothetical protein